MLFISYMVVLFPALDVISVMPINGIIVASNIMASVYGEEYVPTCRVPPPTVLLSHTPSPLCVCVCVCVCV